MKRRILILAIVGLTNSATWASEGNISPLFTVLPGEVASLSPAATAAVPVSIALDQLEQGAAVLRLELPDGPIVDARLADLERRGPGDLVWRGRIEGGHRGELTLTMKNGFVAGLVSLAEGSWEVRTQPGGGQSLERLDTESFPTCGTPPAAEPLLLPEGDVDPCPNPIDRPDRIDVLGYYTPEARDAAGGVAQIEALVQSAVDISNTAFSNAQMIARFRLVDAELSTRSDSGNMSADLNWLASDAGLSSHAVLFQPGGQLSRYE